jgi:hypothetical protein
MARRRPKGEHNVGTHTSTNLAPTWMYALTLGLLAGCGSDRNSTSPSVATAPTGTETMPATSATSATSATATPTQTALATTPPPSAACTLPTKAAATYEETMWQIFAAINCASGAAGGPPLVWETWTEQTCLYDPSTPGCTKGAGLRPLHASRLSKRKRVGVDPKDRLGGDCQDMMTTAAVKKDPKLNWATPFIPKNLSDTAQFCEEVYANQDEVAYVRSPAPNESLLTYAAQQKFVTDTKQTISVPTSGVEVKADWVPSSSLTPSFTCDKPPAGVYVEKIKNSKGVEECYALAAIHLSSKLLPNWIWATFEPQSTVTNPNRCNSKLYSNCNDPWGSDPAVSDGAVTKMTPALQKLMKEANILDKFSNYRLVAVQTDFVTKDKKPTLLGNSFVELNAEVAPGQASCITCHVKAALSTTSGENSPAPAIGNYTFPAPDSQWIKQDFSWMLGFVPSK